MVAGALMETVSLESPWLVGGAAAGTSTTLTDSLTHSLTHSLTCMLTAVCGSIALAFCMPDTAEVEKKKII